MKLKQDRPCRYSHYKKGARHITLDRSSTDWKEPWDTLLDPLANL